MYITLPLQSTKIFQKYNLRPLLLSELAAFGAHYFHGVAFEESTYFWEAKIVLQSWRTENVVQNKRWNLKSSPTFSVRPCSSVGRVTVDLILRLWVRFPPRSKDFFFASHGSLFPFTRANAQWVVNGFKQHFNLHFRVGSLFHYLFLLLA